MALKKIHIRHVKFCSRVFSMKVFSDCAEMFIGYWHMFEVAHDQVW